MSSSSGSRMSDFLHLKTETFLNVHGGDLLKDIVESSEKPSLLCQQDPKYDYVGNILQLSYHDHTMLFSLALIPNIR